jgi:pimeloyl-ACP methyl ester carboxylesterase
VPEPGSVLLIHGLWMTGVESILLRRRLAEAGFRVEQFHYASTRVDSASVIDALYTHVRSMAPPVHLVGHSLGGRLVLRLAACWPDLPLGRLVLLGVPVTASQAARWCLTLPGASWLFGEAARDELLSEAPGLVAARWSVGTVAGSLPLGLPALLAGVSGPSDGTVSVAETHLPHAADSIVLPVSHTGLVCSHAVAEATIRFLRTGRFSEAGS